MRWARSTFLQVIGKNAPAFTVASLAITITRRPETVPIPVTTPADGAPPHSEYMSHAAHRPSSKRSVSGSRSFATRSRAASRPFSCWRSIAFGPPPWRMRASSAVRSMGMMTPRPVVRLRPLVALILGVVTPVVVDRHAEMFPPTEKRFAVAFVLEQSLEHGPVAAAEAEQGLLEVPQLRVPRVRVEVVRSEGGVNDRERRRSGPRQGSRRSRAEIPPAYPREPVHHPAGNDSPDEPET